jgi:L,D-peptidoglycan transpeptidase YkuD (ErfK/YbiS/YcfS/YnhG family)
MHAARNGFTEALCARPPASPPARPLARLTARSLARLTVRLPARARHEELARSDGLYDVVLVLDHNQRPRVRGHGSAIFFHLTRNGDDPTAGCVAIARAQMLRLLPRLSSDCVMIIR